MAVAGYKKEDLEVTFDLGNLTISGTNTAEKYKDHLYEHRGISAGKFVKSFIVSNALDVDSVEFTDGLLTITLNAKSSKSSSKLLIK